MYSNERAVIGSHQTEAFERGINHQSEFVLCQDFYGVIWLLGGLPWKYSGAIPGSIWKSIPVVLEIVSAACKSRTPPVLSLWSMGGNFFAMY